MIRAAINIFVDDEQEAQLVLQEMRARHGDRISLRMAPGARFLTGTLTVLTPEEEAERAGRQVEQAGRLLNRLGGLGPGPGCDRGGD